MEVIVRNFWDEGNILCERYWAKYQTDLTQELQFQYWLHASLIQEKSKQQFFFTFVLKITKYLEIMKHTSTYNYNYNYILSYF